VKAVIFLEMLPFDWQQMRVAPRYSTPLITDECSVMGGVFILFSCAYGFVLEDN
jgi:hypothetical protein